MTWLRQAAALLLAIPLLLLQFNREFEE